MFQEKDFNRLIQRTLLGGVFLSVFLVAAGFGLSLAGAPSGPGLLRAGLLALILTPVARVVMLVYGYWRTGESYFALASFVVLAVLVVSMLAG